MSHPRPGECNCDWYHTARFCPVHQGGGADAVLAVVREIYERHHEARPGTLLAAFPGRPDCPCKLCTAYHKYITVGRG